MKKKCLILLLVWGLLLPFGACSRAAPDNGYTAEEICSRIISSQQELDYLEMMAMGDDGFPDFLHAYYDLEAEMLEDGAICYADNGADAREVVVLRVKGGVDRGDVEDSLLQYISLRTASYWGYLPDQAALLEQAEINIMDPYVALFVLDDPGRASNAFADCVGGRTMSAQAARVSPFYPMAVRSIGTGTQKVDTGAILRAYRSGNYSTLSGKDRVVLEICADVIDSNITPSMSDYQKELAIHDWIINWADYDMEVLNRSPKANPHPDNDNPYGLLVGRRGVCSGYTTTFQLFMDMLDIECITVQGTIYEGIDEIDVRGTVFNNLDEHAWNTVKLDGEWYCVDITWNDIVGVDAATRHSYFNVTSKFMRRTEHHWDTGKAPEATAKTYAWRQ